MYYLANIKGSNMIWIKIFLPSLLKILCSAYTQYTQNNCIFHNTGPIKTFFLTKSQYLSITNYKKVLNTKLDPKKFSRLCTFKYAIPCFQDAAKRSYHCKLKALVKKYSWVQCGIHLYTKQFAKLCSVFGSSLVLLPSPWYYPEKGNLWRVMDISH